nr:putative zinc finger, CCHC-type [Tanacetum cinerariifolium]
MSNIEKIKFPALDITGANYIQWMGYVKKHLKSMGALATIQEGNKCTEETKAKADVFLHQHIDEMLESEYSNCDDPSTLWKDLEIRFNNQLEVLIPSARDEWNNLRFIDFKKEAKEDEVTLVGMVVVVVVVVEIMVTIVSPTKTIVTTEVVIMAVDKEITLTMLHKLIISIRKIMKLVPPKTPREPVSGVEVQITGLKLVAHLHIYVSFTKHLVKEKRKK